MRNLASLWFTAIAATALLGCGGAEPEYDEVQTIDAVEDAGLITDDEQGTSIPVRSDGASYRLISSEVMSNGNLEVVTRRDGSSGRSFARREIDCDAMTFRYLGEGDTLEEALIDGPNPGQLSEAMSTSISGEVSRFACSRR